MLHRIYTCNNKGEGLCDCTAKNVALSYHPHSTIIVVSHSHVYIRPNPASTTVYALSLNLILGPPNTSETEANLSTSGLRTATQVRLTDDP